MCLLQVAVKLLTVDTEDPAVLDAFLKEVALCACLRGCDRVVRLLGACLGGTPSAAAAAAAHHTPAPPAPHGSAAAPPGSSYHTSSTASVSTAAAASPGSPVNVLSMDVTPFQSQLPPDVLADDTPPKSGAAVQQPPQQQWALIMELVEGGNLAHRIYHPSKRRLSYLEVRLLPGCQTAHHALLLCKVCTVRCGLCLHSGLDSARWCP
jgi:hypothetical protein